MKKIHEEMEKVLTKKMKKELVCFLNPNIQYSQMKEILRGKVPIMNNGLFNLEEKYTAVKFRKATLCLALRSEEHRVRYLDLWEIVKNVHGEPDDVGEKQDSKALLEIALKVEKLKLLTLQSSTEPSAPPVEYNQKPFQEHERDVFKNIITEWDDHFSGRIIDNSSLNFFIEKHETVFLSMGTFIKDIRVRKGRDLGFRENIDGVLGIVSMNIEILRNKINNK